MPAEVIIGLSSIYLVLSFTYLVGTGAYAGHHYFNPIVNYEEWHKLNIFGVLVFTLLLNFLFAPWAIIYWVIKILVVLFTIGRR
jgi:hypothetical protein